ncbi:flavodoxin [Barnesiella sp. An55]|uniref:flavodoxin n=1 Tax=Barnesiella sp. An55 TaxID=1965646 RepID=UPI000B386E0A|nr:flavodoxin [Barnesiella sp. An55]OUN73462.1 flavodoxin [Barnesiella sp. An55]HIZ25868.1 flavodoxin [Candidatus Barnesiella merdipullorum]
MKKSGIFYGSTTGITENVAYRLADLMHIDHSQLHDVARSKPSDVGEYDLLLLGSSTWGNGDLQEDWYDFLTGIEVLDLHDKTIALFGCGDQSMCDTFCNAVGIIYQRLQKTGARFVGAFEAGDYTFEHSKAFIDGHFVGLLIDEVNEPEKTEHRLNYWTKLLQKELKGERAQATLQE